MASGCADQQRRQDDQSPWLPGRRLPRRFGDTMRRVTVAVMACAVVPLSAMAEENPHPGAHDARVRYVIYDPIDVVKVVAADLHSTMIQFGADETVDVVAIGDQTAWAWNKVRNLLFIKPSVSPARPSNMQVITL